MKILFFIFTFVLLLIGIFFISVRLAWKAVLNLLTSTGLFGSKPEKEGTIVDVEAEYVSGHTSAEKDALIDCSIEQAMMNSQLTTSDFDTERAAIGKYSQKYAKTLSPQLGMVKRNMRNIDQVFDKFETEFTYTKSNLAHYSNGVNYILANPDVMSKPSVDDFVLGTMFATEKVFNYLKELSRLPQYASHIGNKELLVNVSKMTVLMERVLWIFLLHPKYQDKYRNTITLMVDPIYEKLKMCRDSAKFDSDSIQTKGLINQTSSTISDVNRGLETVIGELLGDDILNASVEMEVLRQELKIRGLS